MVPLARAPIPSCIPTLPLPPSLSRCLPLERESCSGTCLKADAQLCSVCVAVAQRTATSAGAALLAYAGNEIVRSVLGQALQGQQEEKHGLRSLGILQFNAPRVLHVMFSGF